MSTPHDSIFKWTFCQLEHAASELRLLLPAAVVAELDFSTLAIEDITLVDEELRPSYSDLLYSVRLAGRPAYVYLLFEHLSTVEELVAFRLLKYMLGIWDRFLGSYPHSKVLPAIIPVVLHHSSSGWTGTTRFQDLIDPPVTGLPGLCRLIPDFEFLLDDVSVLSNEALLGRRQASTVRAVLWAMRDARRGRRLLENLRFWSPVLGEVRASPRGLEALVRILRYIVDVAEEPTFHEVRRQVIQTVGTDTENVMATIAEQLRQEGRQAGRQEGRQEGEATGQRRLLLKLLRVRFGGVPDRVVVRLETATSEQLDLWAERVLAARSIDEVVDG